MELLMVIKLHRIKEHHRGKDCEINQAKILCDYISKTSCAPFLLSMCIYMMFMCVYCIFYIAQKLFNARLMLYLWRSEPFLQLLINSVTFMFSFPPSKLTHQLQLLLLVEGKLAIQYQCLCTSQGSKASIIPTTHKDILQCTKLSSLLSILVYREPLWTLYLILRSLCYYIKLSPSIWETDRWTR